MNTSRQNFAPKSGRNLRRLLNAKAIDILSKPVDEAAKLPPYLDWCKQTSPEMSWDWPHILHIGEAIEAVLSGECKRLLISVPPQHGKTSLVTHRMPLYFMKHRPGVRASIGTYSATYASRLSRQVKRIAIQTGLKIGEKQAANEWELANGSSLYAVGVGGGITGRSVDVMFLDDCVKSRAEADSEAFRERTWEWYLDDIVSRLQEGAPVVHITTRWHLDDLAGRQLASEQGWRYIRLPAIAEEDDPLGRAVGEPLCPARFSLQTLLERQQASPETFESLYQQNPVARGGSFFRREWFEIVDKPFNEKARRIRYWDLAYTKKETSAWTSGVLMAFADGRYCVEHVERFRETPAERNERIRATLAHDVTLKGFERAYFEDQPAAGVEVAQNLVASCAGLPIQSSQIRGDKAIRAIPFADAARAGLVKVVQGPWTAAFLNELTAFPRGATKDQVDSASSAFTRMAKGGLGIVV